MSGWGFTLGSDGYIMPVAAPSYNLLPLIFENVASSGQSGMSMSDDAASTGPLRIRLSLSPHLRERIDTISAVLGLPDNQIATLAMAMGLRMLDMTLINPVNADMSRAMDARVDSEVRGAAAEGGLKLRK